MKRRADDPHAPPTFTAQLRFYEELNDFLPPGRRKRTFSHSFTGSPSVKDAVEALGVPHTEIDLILVDGRSVGFDHPLRDGERVAVYPMFERLDVSAAARLRPEPLRVSRFVLDVHLGTLARYLRLLGFDALWRNDLDDPELIDIGVGDGRIILTRDRGVLKHARVTHGYWLRAGEPLAQLEEVVRALDLAGQFRPFTRCLKCNGRVRRIDRDEAAEAVPAGVLAAQHTFSRCSGCGRVYWPGSHQRALEGVVARAEAAARRLGRREA